MPKVAEKRPQRSLCGLFDCPECELHAKGNCQGCLAGNLSRRRRAADPCLVYECIREQRIESCWQCIKAECPLENGKQPLCITLSDCELAKEKLQEKVTWLSQRRAQNLQIVPRASFTEPRLTRARWYLSALAEMESRGIRRVCSYDLARATGVKSPLVRRDLSCMGHLGTPSLGYDVIHLKDSIILFFGLRAVCYWIGADRLSATPQLAEQFVQCNCPLTGLFDPSNENIGKVIAGMQVKPLSELKQTAASEGAILAILAVPPKDAQATLDMVVDAGIRGVLSLVSAPLAVPPHVTLQQADLPSQMLLLLARSRKQ